MHSPFPLYDADALRLLEARGTASSDGDAFALMARAGQASWRRVLKHWPQAQRIAVVCGPGNNGGDGYVLARHAQESGRNVQVVSLLPPATPLARRACDEYLAAGGRIVEAPEGLQGAELIVDALFGIGLSREPDAATAALIETINAHPAPVLALDVPSGLDARSGSAPGTAIVADRTLQFIARHRGLRTGVAMDHVGELELATLDLPMSSFDGIAPAASAYRHDALHGFFPLRPRDSHKGRNGHVLCIGGDAGSGGAVMLAADAALHCGAGLVSVATRPAHVPALLARRPEAMAHGIDDVEQLTHLLERADVIAIGPGVGQGAWGQALFDLVLACAKPRVFDADALNLLAQSPRRLNECDVMTPHPGEAARLLGIATVDVQRDRFAAANALRERYGAQVVLKGAGSIVASPEAVPAVICAGNPGMAVGGMGDLLTGCIAALLAQGFAPRDAAIAGALLHASAGDAAARVDGERGLLPSDLLPWLRRLANPMRR
ncbi:NAD(P)H-hydrate dehydratase [Thermomonas sp. HDW16]|uniref:NAD(P)H-hydrate dehydratase n=1 Tax=Thermomonas sp. HDW16 TaxID=2714945 RepID=UPI001409A6C3|nr:NAD(P)H-hydrate dehydratase [Thermomonas sp. HDW16]QIL20408.1 NAD(P)H-hydrate dehydratase [Thermomonas sp. HDW16]